MPYKHLTPQERYCIAHMHMHKMPVTAKKNEKKWGQVLHLTFLNDQAILTFTIN